MNRHEEEENRASITILKRMEDDDHSKKKIQKKKTLKPQTTINAERDEAKSLTKTLISMMNILPQWLRISNRPQS